MEIMIRTKREKDQFKPLIDAGKARIVRKVKHAPVNRHIGKGVMKDITYEVWIIEIIKVAL